MALSLSILAAPELPLEAFVQERQGRGLHGEELIIAQGDELALVAETAAAAGATVVALRASGFDLSSASASAQAVAKLSARLGAPVSVPLAAIRTGDLQGLADVFGEEGGKLLIGVTSDLGDAAALADQLRELDPAAVGICWEVRPSSDDLGDASAILFTVRERLGLVRLHGGGPEQAEQDGLGVGPLLVDLAISRYGGPIVLQPSDPAKLPRWGKWLRSRRSAGCGTKAAEEERLEVDVRAVEPRDRLDTILGAYKSLGRGKTMRLTVDHDPSCMYYTLEATEPEGSFAFRKTADGPEVWRAEVTKL